MRFFRSICSPREGVVHGMAAVRLSVPTAKVDVRLILKEDEVEAEN